MGATTAPSIYARVIRAALDAVSRPRRVRLGDRVHVRGLAGTRRVVGISHYDHPWFGGPITTVRPDWSQRRNGPPGALTPALLARAPWPTDWAMALAVRYPWLSDVHQGAADLRDDLRDLVRG